MKVRQVQVGEEVQSVRFTPDARFYAFALLDNTVKIHYADTDALHLTLYAHKLPVLSISISSDSQLLASGSADKNLKIWGLDFGNLHKSIFAHQDIITQVQFIKDTHYVVTASKDHTLKFFDCDTFTQIFHFQDCLAPVTCFALSAYGDTLITADMMLALREYTQTSTPTIPLPVAEQVLQEDTPLDAVDSLLTALLPFETRKQTKVTDVTILQNTLLSLKENSLDTVLRYLHLGDTEKLLLLLRGMVVNGWEIERCIRIVDAIVKHREGQTFEGMKNALEAMQKEMRSKV